jgi:hypothetical protein
VVYTQPYVIDKFIYHPSSYVGYGEKLGKRKEGVKGYYCEFCEEEVQSVFQHLRGFGPSSMLTTGV